MPRRLPKLLPFVLAAVAAVYGLLWAAKRIILKAPACTQECRYSDAFWRSSDFKASPSECGPLNLEIQLAQSRFDRKRVAPVWYRLKVTNASCQHLGDLRLEAILDYARPLQLKLIDANGREIALSSVAAVEGDRGVMPSDVFFRPDSTPRPPSSLAPGESANSRGYHFEPQRYVPTVGPPEKPQSTFIEDGWVLKPLYPKPEAPHEHHGYNALFYGRFTKPGRYALVAVVQGEARARKSYPRFERLPVRVQHALIVAAQILPIPVPAPLASEYEGRYVKFEARSAPASFEVLP